MKHSSDFVERHIGPVPSDVQAMLGKLGVGNLEELMQQVIPESIQSASPLSLENGIDEAAALTELRSMAQQNVVLTSLLGQGYHHCHTPSVIKRNVLENPAWYTAYTPYQPEIAQGRLEVLFNFQTMITELTAMPIANASLLDEATAAAEAMALAHRALRAKRQRMLVSSDVHPQTLSVLNTRAKPLGIDVVVVDEANLAEEIANHSEQVFAVLLQYPGSQGNIHNPTEIVKAAHTINAVVIVAADLLALTLLSPPGEWGADIVVGSAQRFGVPMGFGGPHAAYMATTDKHKRNLPGRLIGESITALGNPGYRLALQTREQHIRREKATSNICTAQALLAIMATLYACYHGPTGLRAIARRTRSLTSSLHNTLVSAKVPVKNSSFFDTLTIAVDSALATQARAVAAGYNIRVIDEQHVAVSLDETSDKNDVACIASFLCETEISVNGVKESRMLRRMRIERQPLCRKPAFMSINLKQK